jgi:hypothetical protein
LLRRQQFSGAALVTRLSPGPALGLLPLRFPFALGGAQGGSVDGGFEEFDEFGTQCADGPATPPGGVT